MSPIERALFGLHYAYPAIVFVYFATTLAAAACNLQTSISGNKSSHARPKLIILLVLLFVLAYAGQLVLKGIELIVTHSSVSEDVIVNLLSCILVFGIQLSTLGDASNVVWFPFYGSWFIALAVEPVIAVLAILTKSGETGRQGSQILVWIDGSIVVFRYVTLLMTVLVYFLWRHNAELEVQDDERSPLIPKPDQRAVHGDESTDSGYGTNSEGNTDATNSPSDPESPWERSEREAREQMEKRLKSEGSWIAYAKGFLIFFPYVWPVDNRRLQVNAGLVALCLIAGNALNVLIPRQIGIVMDTLSGATSHNPWIQVLIFAALRLASSESGIQFLRQMLWLPVEYYSQEKLSVAAYSHVMNLSSEFHDSKSSSDLILAISHGQSISNMMESICFQALPSLIDLVVAFVYLSAMFGAYEGFITIATGIAFIQAATHMIDKFKERRKKMVKTFFEEHYVRQSGIQGWHTVSTFNQIPYEEQRYKNAVDLQVSSMKSLYSGYFIGQALQYLILLTGLIAGAFLAVWQVNNGQRTAGDFVMLLTYWGQITSPLRFFASLGKSISQDLVYAERLLDVMLTKPTVIDKPDARKLNFKGGKVEFRNVNFSYDKKKGILKGVKLTVPAGKTAAFVGATGAGKSTILKLMDRFYDVTGGSILIDGQDIRDVQLSSLRGNIGVVPQAPVLFDDTIINNIKYARLEATDQEVYDACKAAAIHEHIMGFSEGYKTRVGERGIKLSGGELQRIAIARAILKMPEIVLLDEATSSVDTETEQKIQDGLRILCEDRTTIIVAHRLSTIMNADIIFVVWNGEVVEHGNHEQLLEKKGKYSELWLKQYFLRPKESEGLIESSQSSEEDAKTSKANGVSNTAAASAPKTTGARPKVATPKLDTTVAVSKGNEQTAAKTPKRHRKEVDQSKDHS